MTKDTVDPLLSALGRAAREEREEERALARFEPLASDDLPEDERALLSREAAGDPEAAELLALLRPIDGAGRSRMVEAAAAALREGAAPRDEVAPPARAPSPANGAATHAGDAGAVVVPLAGRRRSWRPAAAAAGALAIAAGVALYVATRGPAFELPAYEASVAGGISTTRGPGDAPPVLVPGKGARVRLRPEHAVTAKVAAIAALRQGDRLTQLEGSVQPFEGGALGLQLTVPAGVPAGVAELLIVVGGQGDLPEAVPADLAADGPQRRVIRVPVVIGAP